MSLMNPKGPQTGSGYAPAAGKSGQEKIKVVVRDPSGKPLGPKSQIPKKDR